MEVDLRNLLSDLVDSERRRLAMAPGPKESEDHHADLAQLKREQALDLEGAAFSTGRSRSKPGRQARSPAPRSRSEGGIMGDQASLSKGRSKSRSGWSDDWSRAPRSQSESSNLSKGRSKSGAGRIRPSAPGRTYDSPHERQATEDLMTGDSSTGDGDEGEEAMRGRSDWDRQARRARRRAAIKSQIHKGAGKAARPCLHFLHGNCRRGEGCSYAHDLEMKNDRRLVGTLARGEMGAHVATLDCLMFLVKQEDLDKLIVACEEAREEPPASGVRVSFLPSRDKDQTAGKGGRGNGGGNGRFTQIATELALVDGQDGLTNRCLEKLASSFLDLARAGDGPSEIDELAEGCDDLWSAVATRGTLRKPALPVAAPLRLHFRLISFSQLFAYLDALCISLEAQRGDGEKKSCERVVNYLLGLAPSIVKDMGRSAGFSDGDARGLADAVRLSLDALASAEGIIERGNEDADEARTQVGGFAPGERTEEAIASVASCDGAQGNAPEIPDSGRDDPQEAFSFMKLGRVREDSLRGEAALGEEECSAEPQGGGRVGPKAGALPREELEGLKRSALRKCAVLEGASEGDLERADDAEDTRAALLALVLARRRLGTPDRTDQV